MHKTDSDMLYRLKINVLCVKMCSLPKLNHYTKQREQTNAGDDIGPSPSKVSHLASISTVDVGLSFIHWCSHTYTPFPYHGWVWFLD